MSSVVDIKRIKNANKRSIFAVYGFIHRHQPFFLNPIIDIVLCFYYLNDKWDDKCKAGNMKLIDENKIQINRSFCCGSALLTNTVSDGLFSWKFKIIELSDEINFGIYKLNHDPSFQTSGRFFIPNNAYTIEATNCSSTKSLTGNLMNPSQGSYSVLKPYGKKCEVGDIYEMILDCHQWTLSFKVNDTDYGVAFSNIEETKYKAAIFMYSYGKGGCIELLQ